MLSCIQSISTYEYNISIRVEKYKIYMIICNKKPHISNT